MKQWSGKRQRILYATENARRRDAVLDTREPVTKLNGRALMSNVATALILLSFAFSSRSNVSQKNHHHHHFICPIIQQYSRLHRYNFRRAGQQGPTRTLTAALKRVIKQLLGHIQNDMLQLRVKN